MRRVWHAAPIVADGGEPLKGMCTLEPLRPPSGSAGRPLDALEVPSGSPNCPPGVLVRALGCVPRDLDLRHAPILNDDVIMYNDIGKTWTAAHDAEKAALDDAKTLPPKGSVYAVAPPRQSHMLSDDATLHS
jgi:hypothetical protein